jgi:copper(I)-binding protein
VGFFTIANAGKTPVTLKRVESAAAAKVEMHQSSMAGGVMSMRRRDDGIVVPAGGQIAFAPGGYHLMLLRPEADARGGAKTFRNAGLRQWPENPGRAAVQLDAAHCPGGAATHALRGRFQKMG